MFYIVFGQLNFPIILFYTIILIMSFTRFHDDPARITKQLQNATYTGRYMLDTPGPGADAPYSADPQLRLQGWGANLMTNTVNLESDLMGLSRKLTHDVETNNYKLAAPFARPVMYSTAGAFVDESRATHPAWMYRDLEQSRWEHPFLNPQANLEKRFQDNIQTRMLEKDFFKPTYPTLM